MTTELVIIMVNALAQENEIDSVQPVIGEIMKQPPAVSATSEETLPAEIQEENPDKNPVEHQVENPEEDHAEIQERNLVEVQGESQEESKQEEKEGMQTRSGRTIKNPSRFMAVTKVRSSDWSEKACELAIKLELS
jgi:hypothetical protein